MAGASIALIPPLVIYAFLSRLLVRGLTAGSVKS
jgi:ABC-type glycerol-3-phosphate transport system permease component